jgi:hypothetical protein
MNYCVLKIKYIPALFPDVNFIDTHVFNEIKIKKLADPEIVLIKTEKKYKTLNNSNLSTEQIIQSIKLDKYQIEIFSYSANEFSNIQLAENIQLIDEYNNVYTVKLIEIESQEAEPNSELYVYVVTFASLEDDAVVISNYKIADYINDKRVNNYNLRLANNYNIDSIIDFENGDKIDFYTEFVPEQVRSEMELTTQKLQNGKTYISTSFDFLIYRTKFILTRAEFLLFQKYFLRCDTISLSISGGLAITNADQPEFVLNENTQLVDLFDIDVLIKTDITKYSHFQ